MTRLALILVLPLALVAGCAYPSAAHLKADQDIYAAAAPYARAGGLDADTDYAWRRNCGYAPTATAVPGGPDDPRLAAGGLPPKGSAK